MSEPLISVILPVYNIERFLPQCMDSLFTQTYKNIEMVIVDDGSEEKCSELCDTYGSVDGRVKVFHKENGGLSDARNFGIRNAKGEYITCIDPDDYVDRDYIEYLYSLIESFKTKMSVCQHRVVNNSQTVDYGSEREPEMLSAERCIERMLYHDVVDTSAWAKMYHRSLFDNISYPVGRLYEDIATTYKLMVCSGTIAVGYQSKYSYCLRDDSIVNNSFSLKKLDLLDMTDAMAEDVTRRFPGLCKAAKRRRVYARFSTLNQMIGVDGVSDKRREIISFIKDNSKGMILNPKVPGRDKAALFLLRMGYPLYEKVWIKHKKGDAMEYDYLVVGAGLYGSVFARQKAEQGARVLIIDKRNHVAGNAFTEKIKGIDVHRYGAHIFHTSDSEVWNYVNRFASFNDYTNSPIARWHDEVYSLPFSMYTFEKMWGVTEPEQAMEIIEKQRRASGIKEPRNLEEQAVFLVGTDIYEKLIKGYTTKQWGRNCRDLPAFIIRRLPVRFTYDNNYFDDTYQGIPLGGYTAMVENILDHENITVQLGEDYFDNREMWKQKARMVVWTGQLDAWFDYRLGALEYRSLRFETEELSTPDFQGNAVVNYTDEETPWIRIVEHKWFTFGKDRDGKELPHTVITREFSREWHPGEEPYYPINDEKNRKLCGAYQELAQQEKNVIFGGRLGEYRYYNMDQVIAAALKAAREA